MALIPSGKQRRETVSTVVLQLYLNSSAPPEPKNGFAVVEVDAVSPKPVRDNAIAGTWIRTERLEEVPSVVILAAAVKSELTKLVRTQYLVAIVP
jgi:hypothetical protein